MCVCGGYFLVLILCVLLYPGPSWLLLLLLRRVQSAGQLSATRDVSASDGGRGVHARDRVHANRERSGRGARGWRTGRQAGEGDTHDTTHTQHTACGARSGELVLAKCSPLCALTLVCSLLLDIFVFEALPWRCSGFYSLACPTDGTGAQSVFAFAFATRSAARRSDPARSATHAHSFAHTREHTLAHSYRVCVRTVQRQCS